MQIYADPTLTTYVLKFKYMQMNVRRVAVVYIVIGERTLPECLQF